MAYNRLNKLYQIKKVIEVYITEKKDGMTTEYVYRTHIYPRFMISRSAFYSYLRMPIIKLIREEMARREKTVNEPEEEKSDQS
jgi:hypothetical protein